MRPLISVVMACFNDSQHLSEAIASVLNQVFKEFEFIIVNDGSTDDSAQILSEYARQDQRIKLFTHSENKGLSASLNRGIKEAQADIIARMDADDISLPNRLKDQFEFLRDHPDVDLLGTAMICVDKKTNKGRRIKTLPETDEEIKKGVFKKTLVFHPTVMVKKSVYEEYGYYNEQVRWAEDADLWYRIYDKVCFHNLSEPLLIYRAKSAISFRIIVGNFKTKYLHLKKRKMLLSNLHTLLKDAFTLSIRFIYNY